MSSDTPFPPSVLTGCSLTLNGGESLFFSGRTAMTHRLICPRHLPHFNPRIALFIVRVRSKCRIERGHRFPKTLSRVARTNVLGLCANEVDMSRNRLRPLIYHQVRIVSSAPGTRLLCHPDPDPLYNGSDRTSIVYK